MLATCAALALAGCASTPPAPVDRPHAKPDTAFRAEGRMSARRGAEGVAVHFNWRHTPEGDTFDIATPLGQVVARMVGDPSGIRVERPGEPVARYASWDTLTEAVLGVAIPIAGLASWVQGVPSAAPQALVERDALGRASTLRERGWEIVYAYRDDATGRPARLQMRYPDTEPIEVRIVVDGWSTPS
ncbi:MAG: outer membrane lipoprotein LolB [Burkholderiales bacterium]|nr:outer membrane lipoprotein LolB [Burkholderiales bacterium]